MTSTQANILTIVLGLCAGLSGNLLAEHFIDSDAPRTKSQREEPRALRSTRAEDTAAIARWLGAAARRQQTETAVSGDPEAVGLSEGDEADDDARSDMQRAMRDPEAAREETLRAWDDRLQQHAHEPVDPDWAHTTEVTFAEDVAELTATEAFEILDASCKTTTCSVEVEWTDYGEAVGHRPALLHHAYRTDCAREIILPEPEDREAPYHATVLFDCRQTREPG